MARAAVTDHRSGRLVFVAHCILNQNTAASGLVKEEYPCAVWDLLDLCKARGVGVEQLPCPEFLLVGYPRDARTKTEYEKEGLRVLCSALAGEVADRIARFRRAGLNVVGIVGVARSPSCGVREVYVGPSRGAQRLAREPGIFVEELQRELGRRGISVPFLEWDFRGKEEALSELSRLLAKRRGGAVGTPPAGPHHAAHGHRRRDKARRHGE
ncbi:TPA: DUF523 domain-containing protein [Candidatus Bathyarchaeota archaeon]|nr:DUF523 domain-containing protein [Candidatus Bathyarchaeota archaeon]